MNHEDFKKAKKALADNPNTKFKFDLDKVIYTFNSYPEVTMYHVSNLLGADSIEGNGGEMPSVASQEAITARLEDSPSVGIDLGTEVSVDPLITVTQEVKYTVVIKGIPFTFTQEEINGLAEELLGFTTL